MNNSGRQPAVTLTNRERDVLRCLAEGMADKEIAKTYGITVSVVKIYMKRLRTKLEARNRLHALVRAIEVGLVDPFSSDEK